MIEHFLSLHVPYHRHLNNNYDDVESDNPSGYKNKSLFAFFSGCLLYLQQEELFNSVFSTPEQMNDNNNNLLENISTCQALCDDVLESVHDIIYALLHLHNGEENANKQSDKKSNNDNKNSSTVNGNTVETTGSGQQPQLEKLTSLYFCTLLKDGLFCENRVTESLIDSALFIYHQRTDDNEDNSKAITFHYMAATEYSRRRQKLDYLESQLQLKLKILKTIMRATKLMQCDSNMLTEHNANSAAVLSCVVKAFSFLHPLFMKIQTFRAFVRLPLLTAVSHDGGAADATNHQKQQHNKTLPLVIKKHTSM
ncbi:hypothetical protein STCU_12067 [Strigomonas culicis]|uniref:Uncharacterized protein n=1 Tax=Strigomonas culicis TaxID=28005 RepID=S9UXW3_9TRYP|nr:hypothetical protein STCU_12067 [Strigomonas culicis]|eukprot:EPY15385.1 hypothetical protein STCU_12067 [Strigomonas culicis]